MDYKAFKECFDNKDSPPIKEPMKVYEVIEGMNKKAATVPGDIPMKLIAEFSVELAEPLAHLFNVCLQSIRIIITFPHVWHGYCLCFNF